MIKSYWMVSELLETLFNKNIYNSCYSISNSLIFSVIAAVSFSGVKP